MTWSDLTQNWALWFERLKARFPYLEDSAMPFLKQDHGRFVAYIAERHHLTMDEAREEFADFLYISTLERELTELRAQG